MKKLLTCLFLSMSTVMCHAQKEVTVKAGTFVIFQAVNTVRAADVEEGESLDFRVVCDILADNETAIPYGTIAKAKIQKAKKSSWWGTRGRLAASITEIVLPNGTVIPIQNGAFEIKGKNRTDVSVILSVLVFPAFCCITGTRAEMPEGYQVVANVASNVNIKID